MTEYISEKHSISGRACVVEDHAGTIWMYLTDAEMSIVADVWVANSVREERREGQRKYPPQAPGEVVVPGADVGIDGMDVAWKVEWGQDGEAVVLLKNGEAVAAVRADERYGRNRFLLVKCPWGNPWI